MSPIFLFYHSKVHIKNRASAKIFFDLNKTRIFYDFLKTLKLTAIGNCRNVRGLGKCMIVFHLFEKLRYSNERSTKFESIYQE